MHIATLYGVPVRLHWTFLAVLLLLAVTSPVANWLPLFGLIALLVLVVVAHEFGHILAARQYGIHTKDVLLTPIGGMARMTKMPENPKAEIKIALAGPAVNFVFALIAMPFVLLDPPTAAQAGQPATWNLAHMFVAVNLLLGVFNLLPAFPMDGGRVLRGLLALRMPRLQATSAAVGVGRVLAVVMVLFGLFYNPWLILIAVFIWLVGGLELRQEQVLEARRRMRHGGGEVPPELAAMLRMLGIDPNSAAAAQYRHAYQQPQAPPGEPDGAPHAGPTASARRARPSHDWPFGGIPAQGTGRHNGHSQRPQAEAPKPEEGPREVKVEVVGARANRPIPGDDEADQANHHTGRDGRHYYKGQELL